MVFMVFKAPFSLLLPIAIGGGVALQGAMACGVAPVQWGGRAKAMERVPYVGPHGKPRAYGGGVCPIKSRHSHIWPPVPRGAFAQTPQGFRDQRPLYPYFSDHSHHDGSCFETGWHLHMEPPQPHLHWNRDHQAFVGIGAKGESVDIAQGPHGARECGPKSCNFPGRHGHRPCRD
jgi:hypothetical protein